MSTANDSSPASANNFIGQFASQEVSFRYGGRELSFQYAQGLLVAVAVVVASAMYRLLVSGGPVPRKYGIPFIGSWAFFTRRHAFIDEGLKRFGNIFSFNILNHEVWALSGEEARDFFFGSKALGFTEGYQVLFGGSVNLDDIDVSRDDESTRNVEWFSKRITNVLHKDRLKITLPRMLQDLDTSMARWGTSGKFDPFDDIYNMVFQLTVRAASCKEIADDPDAVKKVAQLYWDAEKGSTPSSVLLPWLPSAARRRKIEATKGLYTMLKDVVDKRTKEGRVEDDPMQVLLDEGDGPNDIVQFVIGALFAGIINTGIMSSWLVLFLAENAVWKAKALYEIKTFVDKYASKEGGVSLASQLAQIPTHVWEEQMPVLDMCLRETIRIVMTGTTLRRVMHGTDSDTTMTIGGQKLKRGLFLAYHVAGTHHNPDIYPNPMKWDPERFERGEDKKEHWAFLGWGVGRHPCTGMRFAKLEVKLILSLMLTQYEYDVVDTRDKVVTQIPEPRRDNLYQVPPSQQVFVRYKRLA